MGFSSFLLHVLLFNNNKNHTSQPSLSYLLLSPFIGFYFWMKGYNYGYYLY